MTTPLQWTVQPVAQADCGTLILRASAAEGVYTVLPNTGTADHPLIAIRFQPALPPGTDWKDAFDAYHAATAGKGPTAAADWIAAMRLGVASNDVGYAASTAAAIGVVERLHAVPPEEAPLHVLLERAGFHPDDVVQTPAGPVPTCTHRFPAHRLSVRLFLHEHRIHATGNYDRQNGHHNIAQMAWGEELHNGGARPLMWPDPWGAPTDARIRSSALRACLDATDAWLAHRHGADARLTAAVSSPPTRRPRR